MFTPHGFIYKIGNIPIGKIHSVQSALRNVWISPPIAVMVTIGCLSTQTNVKL